MQFTLTDDVDGNVENFCHQIIPIILFNSVILLSNLILVNVNHTLILLENV